MRKTWRVLLVFPIILALFLAACSDENVTTTRQVPLNLDALALTGLWDAVVEVADLQESTAQLDDLWFTTDKAGELISLNMNFTGLDEKSKPSYYRTVLRLDDKMTVYRSEMESIRSSMHPFVIFEEIDKVGLDSLDTGEHGLFVLISFGGSARYTSQNMDIFHVPYPLCDISIEKLLTPATEGSATVSTTVATTMATNTAPSGNKRCQQWFLSEDINRADTVKYLAE